MRCLHAQLFVNSAGAAVFGFDIKPETANIAGLGCPIFDKLVKLAVHLAAARLRSNVDALYPPEPAVSPIAPFVCDHETADDAAFFLGDHIKALLRIAENGSNAAGEHLGVEVFALRFERHRLVEFDECVRLCGHGNPNIHKHLLDETGLVI